MSFQNFFARPSSVSWITPSLLTCAYPRGDEAIADLAAKGVSLIVNLHPRPLDRRLLARHKIQELHLPTPDFTAPNLGQVKAAMPVVERAIANGGRVAVNCGGGLGRSGTFAACYLVQQGQNAGEAITNVRRARPGSIETRDQESLVFRFEKLLKSS